MEDELESYVDTPAILWVMDEEELKKFYCQVWFSKYGMMEEFSFEDF